MDFFRKTLKKCAVIIIVLSLFMSSISVAYAYVSVKGYYRKNGTYVKPYIRSNPNGLKYDNYGYKPSQGLYNPSYGTKGATWDTPTYITDPNYYEGKSLYENNQSGIAPYLPTNTLRLPTPSVTPQPTIPSHSYSIGSTWYCDSGYSKNTSSNTCDKVVAPANSYVRGSAWYCNSGYSKNYYSNTCDEVVAPANGYVRGSTWYCNSGYSKNYYSDTCDEVVAPANGYVRGSSWYCNTGYSKNYYSQSCELTK